VVTINSHQPYLHLLGGLGHDFVVLDRGLRGSDCPWQDSVRPLPAGFRLATLTEGTALAHQTPFDVGIAHNITDLLTLKDLCPRLVLIIHGTLAGRIASETSRTGGAEFLQVVSRYLDHVPARLVYVSELKAASWTGLPGEVIDHGIPLQEYDGYNGELPAVLRVANLQRQRDILLDHTLQQVVLRGIPTTLYGWNPDVPGAALAGSWEELKQAYRRHRCFLITNRAPLEDGYNLALLEAMATGMAVVTTPHPSSPVRDGENGLVGRGADALRQRVSQLLHDREQAVALGGMARQTVADRFPYDRFLARWERLLREVAGQVLAPRAEAGSRAESAKGEPVAFGKAMARPRRGRPRLQLIAGSGPAAPSADRDLRKRLQKVPPVQGAGDFPPEKGGR
jgi:hypothetical protein